MKKHLFRIIAVLSAAVLLAGCAASRLRLGAAAAGGVYNAFGTAMSAQNSTIEVKQTAGSAADDHDVIFHRLAGHFRHGSAPFPWLLNLR